MRKIVIANNKGGVAKTTTVYNLASYFAKKGKKVLVIDCDPQGNLTDALGVDPNDVEYTIFDAFNEKNIKKAMIKLPQAENFYLVPSNLESERVNTILVSQISRESVLRKILEEVENDFDICMIDTSPSLSLLTINAIVAADSVYVTLKAGYFELRGAGLLISTINEIKQDLNDKLEVKGLILAQYDIRTSLSKDSKEQLEQYFSSTVMTNTIRQNVDLAKAPAHAQDIFTYAPNSNGAKDYELLANEMFEREGLKW